MPPYSTQLNGNRSDHDSNRKIQKSLTISYKRFIYSLMMADVVQLVRTPGCGPGGRRFETGHSPHLNFTANTNFLEQSL